jgi:CheY-like chemotaxis protein
MQADGSGASSNSSSGGGGGGSGDSHDGLGLGFDLVLMDHHFENAGGVLTGEEALVQLRAQGQTLPIIMCTGNCSAQDTQRYAKSGASAVWPKPYPSSEEMAASLTSLLGWADRTNRNQRHQQELQLHNYEEDNVGGRKAGGP